MLRLIEISTWALGGVIVGVLAGYGLAALTRCPPTSAAARPDTRGRTIPFSQDRQYGRTGTEG